MRNEFLKIPVRNEKPKHSSTYDSKTSCRACRGRISSGSQLRTRPSIKILGEIISIHRSIGLDRIFILNVVYVEENSPNFRNS